MKNLKYYDPNIYNEGEDNFEISQKTSYKLFNVIKQNLKIDKNDNNNNKDKLSKNINKNFYYF